jgi:hypothetical protein
VQQISGMTGLGRLDILLVYIRCHGMGLSVPDTQDYGIQSMNSTRDGIAIPYITHSPAILNLLSGATSPKYERFYDFKGIGISTPLVFETISAKLIL